MKGLCFECEAPGDVVKHHIIPRSRGGVKTVPLCDWCHDRVHSKRKRKRKNTTSELTKAGLARARARGVTIGNPKLHIARIKAVKSCKAKADAFARKIMRAIKEIRRDGTTTLSGIAIALNEKGILTARGNKWFGATVRLVILRHAEIKKNKRRPTK